RKTIAILTLAVVLMFGFSFALVPLYRVACKKIGLNTSIPISNFPEAPLAPLDSSKTWRLLKVQLLTIKNQGLDWDFYPKTNMVQIRVGEKAKVLFHAKNNTQTDMTVQAIPSMTPTESISHFHKLECFCFNQQVLKAGEEKTLALVFQVDKDLPPDVHTITLAYTLFDVTPSAIKKELG
ncbi:MAG TPA: cytochrome c oxidase assembly protein, partial [Gammaproteobacteria bacterium]|nr:cytochrome c oxidase assembly protein [Gammaproteobacteria bacterium]